MKKQIFKKYILFFSILGIISILGLYTAKLSYGFDSPPLKVYMRTFLTLAADLRMEDIKGKNPDWKAIKGTLEKMNQNLNNMRRADPDGAYKVYLDQVAFSLSQLKRMDQKRDPKISETFDSLTNSCLQCHSAHLPKESTRYKGKME